jgi:hypothetical protein
MRARHVLVLAAFALVLVPGMARADEPPPAPGNPPGQPPAPPGGEVPGGPGAPGAAPGQPASEPPDLHTFLDTLERQIERLRVAPTHTPADQALFDFWNSILSPRAPRMSGRIRNVAEKRRWVITPAGRAAHLQPAAWDTVVREVATLYTELDGALQQYRDVRVKYTRPTTLGVVGQEPGPPDPNAPARALSNLESAEANLAQKVNQGQLVWMEEMVWYWSLLRSAEMEVQRYERDLERWQRQVQAFEDLQARIAYGLSFQRQSLALQKFALRAFVAALQAAEEDRLRQIVAALPAGTPSRVAADALVADLRRARNAAENHDGPSASAWGALLRSKWMNPRKKLVDLLAAAERDAKADAEARAAGGGWAAPPVGPPPSVPAPGAPGGTAPK